jgi:hypothetical protein
MENTITRTADGSLSRNQQSALQNTATSTTKLKLMLLWLAVGFPLLWGVLKALEDVKYLFL